MATRSTRDPELMRRLDATLELAQAVLDEHGVTLLTEAAERLITLQAERSDDQWTGLHAYAG